MNFLRYFHFAITSLIFGQFQVVCVPTDLRNIPKLILTEMITLQYPTTPVSCAALAAQAPQPAYAAPVPIDAMRPCKFPAPPPRSPCPIAFREGPMVLWPTVGLIAPGPISVRVVAQGDAVRTTRPRSPPPESAPQPEATSRWAARSPPPRFAEQAPNHMHSWEVEPRGETFSV